MAEQQIPQVVVQQAAADPTWSTKEVIIGMETRINHRLDRQDDTLGAIQSELRTMATKEDIREVHERIDGVVATVNDRLVPLEQQSANEKAIEQNRGRFRSNLAWAAGIAGTCAIIASVAVPFLVH